MVSFDIGKGAKSRDPFDPAYAPRFLYSGGGSPEGSPPPKKKKGLVPGGGGAHRALSGTQRVRVPWGAFGARIRRIRPLLGRFSL